MPKTNLHMSAHEVILIPSQLSFDDIFYFAATYIASWLQQGQICYQISWEGSSLVCVCFD